MNRFAVKTNCKVRTLREKLRKAFKEKREVFWNNGNRTRSDSCDSDRLADDIQNSAHRSDQHDLR